MADLFKQTIPSILKTGIPVISKENEKDYVPYQVNVALSLHYDTVMYADLMNINTHLPKKMQYDYLINKVRHYSRQYQPWPKKVKITDLEVLKSYYNCSIKEAKEYLRLLTSEELDCIKQEMTPGGVDKNNN